MVDEVTIEYVDESDARLQKRGAALQREMATVDQMRIAERGTIRMGVSGSWHHAIPLAKEVGDSLRQSSSACFACGPRPPLQSF